MLKFKENPVVRAPLNAKPQSHVDRKSLREMISSRFSKSLEYLSK
jgi:hypothetical protein